MHHPPTRGPADPQRPRRRGPSSKPSPGGRGHEVAKTKGRLQASSPSSAPTQEAHLVKLYHAGEHTVSELEELFGVTRSTVYRAIRRAQASKTAVQR